MSKILFKENAVLISYLLKVAALKRKTEKQKTEILP